MIGRCTACYRLAADTCIDGQQNLGTLNLGHRMFATAQHRRELRAFHLAQYDSISYVRRRFPAIEGNFTAATGTSATRNCASRTLPGPSSPKIIRAHRGERLPHPR